MPILFMWHTLRRVVKGVPYPERLEKVYPELQPNLSVADILYSGHVVITDRFSRNQPHPGQTLIAKPLYSKHYF